MEGAAGAVLRNRRFVPDRGTLGLGQREGIGRRSRFEEEGSVGRLRRAREAPLERMDENGGSARDDGWCVPPEPEREPQTEVRRAHGIRALAWQKRGRRRDADHDRVDGLRQPDAFEQGAAKQRFGVSDRRQAAEDGGGRERAGDALEPGLPEPAGRTLEDAPQTRPEQPVDRLLVVRIAGEWPGEPRRVEHERDAVETDALCEALLELACEPPARGRARLEQRACLGREQRLRTGRAEQCGGTAVQHRLRCGHRDDQIRLDEGAVHPQGDLAQLPEPDEIVGLHVVHDQPPAKPPPKLGGDERGDLARRRPPQEAAGDEDRHVHDAEAHQLVRHRRDRGRSRAGG